MAQHRLGEDVEKAISTLPISSPGLGSEKGSLSGSEPTSTSGDKRPLIPHEENLERGLSSRQVTMIAIAGCIGSGLWLSTGRALANGGPGSLLICYSLIGFIVGVVMLCLGEMSAEFPQAGSFGSYATRFWGPSWGFAININYAFNDAVSVAGDLTACQVLMAYWTPNLNWLPSLCFWFLLLAINLIHVRAYGELEYTMAILKVITIVIFFFLSIAVNVGGNTDHVYIGAQNWTIGAAPFVNGFRGFASIFVTASFAFGGTESIGLTAGETRNPSRNIPRTIKRTWVRIFIFYVLTVLLIGFNIPYNYPGLKTKGTATSPFTIVWARAGAKAGGSFMNTVIMTSLLSAGNHALFCGSRVLYGMAVNHQAPAIFRKTTKAGVPWTCVLAIASVSLITFGASFLPGSASEIFTWCQNLVGVSNQLAWLTIGITSWRFRRSWVAQGRSLSELKFRNPLGAFAAPFVCVSITVIILVQGWSSFAPWDVESFLSNYIELPVFVLCYLFWRLFKQVSKTPSITEVDLDSGRYVDTERDEADNAQIERRENGRWGWAWKAYSWIA